MGDADARGRAAGLGVLELGVDDVPTAAALDRANYRDYPRGSPAIEHDVLTVESLAEMLDNGARMWGGLLGGQVVGVAVAARKGAAWWDISFASVLGEHRRQGVGQAIAATVIRTLAAEGATRISTGGAASNAASRGAVLARGGVLEPEWRTYEPPEGPSR